MKLAASVPPCLDNGLRWARPRRTNAPRSRRQVPWHVWKKGELGLQCRSCFRVAKGNDDTVPMDGCRGLPPFLRGLLRDPMGHKL
eukprot:277246-Pyramimonas_sp.AAC.1